MESGPMENSSRIMRAEISSSPHGGAARGMTRRAPPEPPCEYNRRVEPFAPVHEALLAALREAVGESQVLTAPESLERYASDATEGYRFLPEVVTLPGDAGQVAAVLALAARARVAVTPRGGGSGLSGGALPVAGGIVLSVERLDRIRSIDAADMVAEVESGVRTIHLHEALEEKGLLYPPDPSSRDMSMLGGNLGEDAAGPRS